MRKASFLLALALTTAPTLVAGRPPTLSIRDLGASGTGTADDSAAFSAAFARADSPTITFPPGTYRIPCGKYFRATSAVSFIGAGQDQTTIKYDPGCRLLADRMAWDGKSGVTLRDLTIDFNNPEVPQTLKAGVVFLAYSASVTGLLVENVAILNGSDRMFVLAVAANAGHTFANPVIANSVITLGRPGTLQNQCIAFTTNNLAGDIRGAKITNNRCVGSGIQYDGGSGTVSGNDVSGFKFGTGIFSAYNDPPRTPQSCRQSTFSNNNIHSTTSGVDSNRTAFGGIENSCTDSLITKNKLHGLGGAAISNFARNVTIANNQMWDNGRNGDGGAGGYCDQGAICVGVSPLGAPYDSDNIVVEGNRAWNSGTKTQVYSYVEAPGFKGRSTVKGNDFEEPQRSLRVASPQTKVEK